MGVVTMKSTNNPTTSHIPVDTTRYYSVFLSYQHLDNRDSGREWANWLHHCLETYDVPPDLVGKLNKRGDPIPKSLYPVFRDEEELLADADLSANICRALEQSSLLVVLCSPRSVASKYVAEEIRYFKNLGRTDRILPFIIDGEPNATDHSDTHISGVDSNLECFPEPLRFGVASADELVDWTAKAQPIAADARPRALPDQGYTTAGAYRNALQSQGKLSSAEISEMVNDYSKRLERAKLKVIAGALGIPLSELIQRDKAYQLEKERLAKRSLQGWLSILGVLLIVAVIAASFAYLQNQNALRSFSQSDFSQATDLLSRGDRDRALLFSTRGMKNAPMDATVSAFLTSSLFVSQVSRMPRAILLHEDGNPEAAYRPLDGTIQNAKSSIFSPDGRRILTKDTLTARLWDAETGISVGESMRHESNVNHAVFSPDGRLVLTSSDDNTARMWDAETGKPLGEAFLHKPTVQYASFSPDGRQIVTISDDEGDWIRIWKVETSKQQGNPSLYGRITRVDFSPDGRRLFIVSDNKNVYLLDTETGNRVGEFMPHQSDLKYADFTSDGLGLITIPEYGEAHLWDVMTGKTVALPICHKGKINDIDLSPDGKTLAIASDDNTACLMDTKIGKPIGMPMQHDGRVNSVQFIADGSMVLTASADNTARLWSAKTGEPSSDPMQHESEVKYAKFSPDGLKFVTVSDNNTFRIWHTSDDVLIDPIHTIANVDSFSFSPDGRQMMTKMDDYTVRIWDAETGKPLGMSIHRMERKHTYISPDWRRIVTADSEAVHLWDLETGHYPGLSIRHEKNINHATFSPDGQKVLTASDDNAARLWDAGTGKPFGGVMEHESAVNQAIFSPDGHLVMTASENTAQLWDAESGKPLGEPMRHKRLKDTINHIAFSPDGRLVVTASDDKTARLWDANTGKPLGGVMQHESAVNHAVFSPDGLLVVTSSFDKTARLWDVKTGKSLGDPMIHASDVNQATFSTDGRKVVTAAGDYDISSGEARVWDAKTGKPLTKSFRHKGRITNAAFSPDGSLVVTASEDTSARLWYAQTGVPLGEPMRHKDVVNQASFSPDGRWVLTASNDGTARVWDSQSGRPMGESLQHEKGVIHATFSPDGHRVLTASYDGTAHLWDLPPVLKKKEQQALLPILEAASSYLFNQQQGIENKSISKQTSKVFLLQEVDHLTDLSPETRAYFRWYLMPPLERTLSPYSKLTVKKRIADCLEEGTEASLNEVLDRWPSHPLALAKLALLKLNNTNKSEIDPFYINWHSKFLADLAAKKAPNDTEVMKIVSEVRAKLAESNSEGSS